MAHTSNYIAAVAAGIRMAGALERRAGHEARYSSDAAADERTLQESLAAALRLHAAVVALIALDPLVEARERERSALAVLVLLAVLSVEAFAALLLFDHHPARAARGPIPIAHDHARRRGAMLAAERHHRLAG